MGDGVVGREGCVGVTCREREEGDELVSNQLTSYFSSVTKYIIFQYPPRVCTVGKDVQPWMVTPASFMQMRAVSPFFRRLRLMSASPQSL